MASIYFIPINSSQKVPPIYNRVYKIVFAPIDLTEKLSDFIILSRCNVTSGTRPSHDQHHVAMKTQRSNCAVGENHLRVSTFTFAFSDDVT